MKFSSDEIYSLVSHENTYDSSIEVHVQPNAQFSRDGKHIIYESDRNQMQNIDLYLVEVPEQRIGNLHKGYSDFLFKLMLNIFSYTKTRNLCLSGQFIWMVPRIGSPIFTYRLLNFL